MADIEELAERAREASRLLAEQQSLLGDLARRRRQAIAELRAAGLTQAQVAEILGVTPARAAQLDKASVVVERAIPTEPAVRASASLFLSEADQQGITARRQMLEVGEVPAPAHIAGRMRIAEGDAVVIRSKLMFVNEVPVRIASSYFPVELARGTSLTDPDFVGEGLQVLFESMGRRFGRAVETFTARMPTAEETRLLDLGPDVPVVHVLRSSYDTDDNPIHTLDTICAGDRHVFPVRQAEGDAIF